MANEKRLDVIDRRALLATMCKEADKYNTDHLFIDVIVYEIEHAPTVDAAPVVHGRWIKVHEWCGVEVLKCSVCGREHPRLPTAYCCDCGAKMDGGNEDV